MYLYYFGPSRRIISATAVVFITPSGKFSDNKLSCFGLKISFFYVTFFFEPSALLSTHFGNFFQRYKFIFINFHSSLLKLSWWYTAKFLPAPYMKIVNISSIKKNNATSKISMKLLL